MRKAENLTTTSPVSENKKINCFQALDSGKCRADYDTLENENTKGTTASACISVWKSFPTIGQGKESVVVALLNTGGRNLNSKLLEMGPVSAWGFTIFP